MASIQKHLKGYRAQVFVRGVRDSATFRTRREAETWAYQREVELRKVKKDSHTLADAFDKYAKEVSPTKGGERWEIVRITAFLKDPILPVNLDISTIQPEDIGKWRDARSKTVQAGTIRREMALLSAVFETARREWRWIESNPLNDVRKPKKPDHREITITPLQTIKMLRAMSYHSGQCKSVTQAVSVAFLFALRTGLRAGEICKLKWSDVFDDYFMVSAIEQGAKKTGKRPVPIFKTQHLIEKMRGYDPVYVFGLNPQSLDAMFRKYRNRAGLSGFTFHDSRHTAATMLSKRVDVLTLCKIFGWKSTSMALVYFNPTPESIKQQLERGRLPK